MAVVWRTLPLVAAGMAIESDWAREGTLGDRAGSVFTGAGVSEAGVGVRAGDAPEDDGFDGTESSFAGVPSVLIAEVEAS